MPISPCFRYCRILLLLAVAAVAELLQAQPSSAVPPVHVFFRVQAPPSDTPVSGRLLIFLKAGSGDKEVSTSEMHPTDTWVCAREVHNLAPGSKVEVDADEIAYPRPFSGLESGIYEAQAVLDVNHQYNYRGRAPLDWVSPVVTLAGWKPGVGAEPELSLERRIVEDSKHAEAFAKLKEAATPDVAQFEEFESPLLSRFWGHPTRIKAWVILPPGYAAPLTTEFIPRLEKKYRMDAKPAGRLLNGHSSGGWATLQLQVNYPGIFGGTWSTSPDPSDFHDFTNVDLYSPDANLYHNPDGSPVPIMRDKGKVMATMEQLARLEEVLGPYGGQLASFDWVFSPKGTNGAPEPMFDRVTGQVHADVVAYWRDHYVLAHIVESTWLERGPDLKGRIHLIVGAGDTFYLDGSAHKFEAVLNRLGAEPHFTYLPDRTHFNLYDEGKDHMALFDKIAGEMWEVARPGTNWKATQTHPQK